MLAVDSWPVSSHRHVLSGRASPRAWVSCCYTTIPSNLYGPRFLRAISLINPIKRP